MSELFSLILYIFIYSISALLFSMYYKCEKKYSWVMIFLSILIPSILSGLRFMVGTDYENYYYTFRMVKNYSLHEILTLNILNMEKGFLLLVKLLRLIISPKMVFAVISFITLAIFAHTLLTQYSKFDCTVCYFYFLCIHFTSSLNITRQYLAIVIVFYSLRFIHENKPKEFFVIIAMTAFLHLSALLAAPMWFLWDHKNNRSLSIKKGNKWLVISFVIVYFWKSILDILLSFKLSYISKYARYLHSNNANNKSFYLMLIIGATMIVCEKIIKKYDKRIDFFIYLYLIAINLEYMGFYVTFIKRAGLYYSFPCILILTKYKMLLPMKERNWYKIILLLYSLGMFIVDAYILRHGEVFPYRWS